MLTQEVAGSHSCKLNRMDHSPEVFVLLIQLTAKGKHLRQAGRIVRCLSPEVQYPKTAQVVMLCGVGLDHSPGKGI